MHMKSVQRKICLIFIFAWCVSFSTVTNSYLLYLLLLEIVLGMCARRICVSYFQLGKFQSDVFKIPYASACTIFATNSRLHWVPVLFFLFFPSLLFASVNSICTQYQVICHQTSYECVYLCTKWGWGQGHRIMKSIKAAESEWALNVPAPVPSLMTLIYHT